MSKYQISVLTNVTDGGDPDIEDQPTNGLIADTIIELIKLSDAIAENKEFIENPPTLIPFFGNTLTAFFKSNIKNLKALRYSILAEIDPSEIPEELENIHI